MENETTGLSEIGMTRPFYSNALSAAWQAKMFGMMFMSENGADAGITNEGFTEFTKGGDKWLLLDKLYVHESSLPLLEPRILDVVQLTLWNGDFKDNHVGSVAKYGEIESAGDRSIGNIDFKEDGMRWIIINRRGVPFHWPQFEPQQE